MQEYILTFTTGGTTNIADNGCYIQSQRLDRLSARLFGDEQFEKDDYQKQLKSFLDSNLVGHHLAPGLEKSHFDLLRRIGIKTASDIDKLKSVDAGFDLVLKNWLLSWRNKLEKQFVYEPISTQEIESQMHHQFTQLKTRLRNEIKNNFQQLKFETSRANEKYQQLVIQSRLFEDQLAQAKYDLQKINRLYKSAKSLMLAIILVSFCFGLILHFMYITQQISFYKMLDKYKTIDRNYQKNNPFVSAPTYTNKLSEQKAREFLQTIVAAEQTFQSTNAEKRYGSLRELAEAELIPAFNSNHYGTTIDDNIIFRNEYSFTLNLTAPGNNFPARFSVLADPKFTGHHRMTRYRVDQTGNIKVLN